MSKKGLTILLIFLLLLFCIVWMLPNNLAISDQPVILSAKNIEKIEFLNKKDDFKKVIILKEGKEWVLTKGNLIIKVKSDKIIALVKHLKKIRSKGIVAAEEIEYEKYKLVKDEAITVNLFADGGDKESFMISEVVRKKERKYYFKFLYSNEVYEISSKLYRILSSGMAGFRDSSLLKLDSQTLRQISLYVPKRNKTYEINKDGYYWYNYLGRRLIPDSIHNWIQDVSSLDGDYFADEIDNRSSLILDYQFSFKDKSKKKIIFSVFKDFFSDETVIIHCDLNKSIYFRGEKQKWNQLFYKRFWVVKNDW